MILQDFATWLFNSPDVTLLMLGAAAVGGSVGIVLFLVRAARHLKKRRDQARKESRRDRLALKVGACLRDHAKPPPFALYLRPFNSTGYRTFVRDSGTIVGGAWLSTVSVNEAVAFAYRLSDAGAATSGVFNAGSLLGGALDGDMSTGSSEDSAPGEFLAVLVFIGVLILWLAMILSVAGIILYLGLWWSYKAISRSHELRKARRIAHSRHFERTDVPIYFERELQDALTNARGLDLIGLGNPDDKYGAGRLRVRDSEWKEYIMFMMEHSALNVLVLSPRPGTLWEINTLLDSDGWKKTVFIQPASDGISRGDFSPMVDYEGVTSTFAHRALTIPAYDPLGVAFTFTDLATPPLWKRGVIAGASVENAYYLLDLPEHDMRAKRAAQAAQKYKMGGVGLR